MFLDLDDGYCVKHVAHSRYLRNHVLIDELFNDVVMSELGSVVTNTRIQIVQKRVESLSLHQVNKIFIKSLPQI